ncbi:P-loop containing nucleoside triphosphate hydrolase protein, partial [Mycena metata]
LPSKPKIFHGRESELEDIIQLLAQDSPRLAILGGGGMGKTSLARAVLHHPDTCAKFQERFFVSAEATTNAHQLATLTGLHLGLEPSGDPLRTVVHTFAEKEDPCLLVLDNLETPWEPRESCRGVEDFLALLAGVKHLALIITMRGSERPGKVQWTRPFLPPLQPLSDGAAQKTFDDITDDPHDSEEKIQLLRFTENMPLAVDLMAHLVDYEGVSNVLTRWQVEKTAVLSVGYTRNSNLDASITTSFSSPRLTAGAKQLLSVLAVLPDGLSDIELMQINILIPGIHSCKSALLATSLAYKDTSSRLRSLVPIREHIHQFYPPS